MLKNSKKGIQIQPAMSRSPGGPQKWGKDQRKSWLSKHEFSLNRDFVQENPSKKSFHLKESLLVIMIAALAGAGFWLWQDGVQIQSLQTHWNLRLQNMIQMNQILSANIEEQRLLNDHKSAEIRRMNQALKSMAINLRELQVENKELQERIIIEEEQTRLAAELAQFHQARESELLGKSFQTQNIQNVAAHIRTQL